MEKADVANYLFTWLRAVIVEKRKVGTAVVMCSSEQGAGKGIVLNQFIGQRVVGTSTEGAAPYVQIGDINQLVGIFNDLSANRLLINADEPSSYGGAFKMNNVLKSLITEHMRKWEKKGLDAVLVEDNANLFVTTNDAFPVKVECTDRRNLVLTPSARRVGDKAYFDELQARIEDPLAAVHFYKFLEQFDAGVDLRTIPMTQEKAQLMSINIPPPAKFMQDFIMSGEVKEGYTMALADLRLMYCEWNSDVAKEKGWDTFFNQTVRMLPIEVFKSSTMKARFGCPKALEQAMRNKHWWDDERGGDAPWWTGGNSSSAF